jgi:ABC-2 type transport system permease protein
MSFFEQIKRSLAIVKKDLSIYYLKGPVLMMGILTPLFMFFAFAVGKHLPLDFLIPGLLGMSLFFAGSSIGPMIAPWETRMKTFERLVSAPIAMWAIILGDVIASFLLGLFVTGFVLIISIFLLGVGIITWPLIIGTIVGAFCFASFGLLISAPPTDKPADTMMLSTMLKFPLLFISGVFIPISTMGAWKILAYISPLTYYTDIARGSVGDVSHFGLAVDLLVLLGFGILFFILAIVWHKKNLSKRF